MKNVIVCLLICLSFPYAAFSGTVGYWQLDGSSDSKDAILAHGLDDYLDLTVFGTVSSASAAVDPIPNPAGASWRWQAGDGNAVDNSNSQAFASGSGWYLDPMDANLYFDNNKSFTAECWFNVSSPGYIMGNRHADSYLQTSGWFTGWQLWATSDGTVLTLYAEGDPNVTQGGATSEVIITTSITKNTWHHAAVVWDHDDGTNGTLTLYLNGSSAGSSAGDAAWSGVSGGSWAIGQRNLWVDEGDLGLGTIWGQNGFTGNIDEVRYVDEALTTAQFLNGSTPYAPVDDIVTDGDVDLDGDVDFVDFALLVLQWQKNTDPNQPDANQL